MFLIFAYYDNPILRKKAKPVEKITAEIRQLVSEMQEILLDRQAVGLAAPQVSVSLAIFVSRTPAKQPDGSYAPTSIKTYINPKILAQSEEKDTFSEGCLSFPAISGEASRSIWVKLQAMNLEGEIFEEELHHMDARAFLHEYDHLQGICFVDYSKETLAKTKEFLESATYKKLMG